MQLVNKIGVQDELFNASHPFLFFIEDETTGTVVFVGKFMHPEVEVRETKPVTTTTTKKPTQRPNTNNIMRSASPQNTRKSNSPKLYSLIQKKIQDEAGTVLAMPNVEEGVDESRN